MSTYSVPSLKIGDPDGRLVNGAKLRGPISWSRYHELFFLL